jgi:hypothetical protein
LDNRAYRRTSRPRSAPDRFTGGQNDFGTEFYPLNLSKLQAFWCLIIGAILGMTDTM